ncbi:hypothetical protein SAMN05518800_3201 [Variovorax sp. YR752]|uniref:hypothetical protein n=1 Tax=Variovorax sp. YR752 TaxID=1884383 RepID=UPI000BD7A558|nr:hypothetical protein [Variovorax sp. YR752]SOD27637.1 hypothetical protein SAMN05518800_3201 [Variovorax sp. YR752]
MNRVYIESPRPCGKTTHRGVTVVAFTGKTGAGKDSAAAVLHNHCQFDTIAFADALRREIAAAWRIDERMLSHRPTKEWSIPALAVGMCSEPAFISWCFDAGESIHEPRSPRWMMQHWADFQRRYRPSYYADIVIRWISRQASVGFRRFAITDLRDPQEETALRALGVQLSKVRVIGPYTSTLSDDTVNHNSERHQIVADYELMNDGSLEALHDCVLALPPVRCLTDEGRTEFTREMLTGTSSAEANPLDALVRQYRERCEAYDCTVCTGPMGRDGILPATEHERGLITLNARMVRAEILARHNIGPAAFSAALQAFDQRRA